MPAKPSEDLAVVPPEIAQAGVEFAAVNPEPFRPMADLFLPGIVGTDKRSMPAIKTPAEFGLAAALVAIRSYEFNKEGDIAVLKGLGKQQGGPSSTARLPGHAQPAGRLGGGGSAGRAPPMMAPGAGSLKPGMAGHGLVDTSSGKDGKIEFVKLEELEAALAKDDVKLAEDLVPLRIGIITASFPYRQQCEGVPRRAQAVVAGGRAPRRETEPALPRPPCKALPGATRRQDYQLGNARPEAGLHADRDPHRPSVWDEDLLPLIFDGLVIPRPLQFEGKTDAQATAGDQKTIADLKKAANAGQVVNPANRRFSKDDLDIFSKPAEGNEDGGGAATPGKPTIGPMPMGGNRAPPTTGGATYPEAPKSRKKPSPSSFWSASST